MYENDQNNSGLNNQFDGMSVSGVENVTKKGKGKKAALIGGISAAVIVGGSAAAYGLSDTVKNQVKLRMSKPEKYYAWVTEKNSETLGKLLSESYKKELDKYEKGENVKFKFSYAPTEDAKDQFLKYAIDEDYESEADEDEKNLIDIVKKHDEYAIASDVSFKKGVVNSNFGLDLSGDRFLSFESAFDMNDIDVFFRVPELKKQWIGLNVNVEEAVSDIGMDSLMDTYKDIVKDPASYLSPEDLETEVNRYVNVWGSFADSVRVEKKEKVDICDIEVDYTVATIKMTEKDVAQLGLDMLKELRDDKYVKKLVTDKLDVVEEDEYKETIDNLIDSAKSSIEDGDLDDEETFLTVDTYIDFTGTVRGLKLTNDDDESFFMAISKDGDDIRAEVTFTEDGEEVMSAKLNAVEDSKKYTGDVVFTYEDSDDEVKVEFEDFKLESDDKLYFSGDFVINVPDVDPIKISCKSNGKKQEIAYELNINGKDYGKLALEYSADNDVNVEIPDKNDAYMISTDDISDFELEKYVTKDEFSKFSNDLIEKLGFSGDTAKDLADEMTDEIFDKVDDSLVDDDYDWDDDWDDYDFDDDDDFGSSSKGKKQTTTSAYDDDVDYDYNFDDFDWSSLKYEDYKDFMTKEEFDDFVKEMQEYSSSAKKAS